VSAWRKGMALATARFRKLRRDPVSFVDDAPSDLLREVGLRALVVWTHVADAFDADLRCAVVQWGRSAVRLVQRSSPLGAAERWVVVDAAGRPPACWPRRVRVHARGGDAVLSAFGVDGGFRSGALATPSRPALLTLDGQACEFSVQFLNPENQGQLVIEPIGRAGVYHGERGQAVMRTTALRRALPPGRPAFAKVSAAGYQAWIARNESGAPPLGLTTGPKAAVLMALRGEHPRRLKAAIASVRAQTYADWELRIAQLGSLPAESAKLLDRLANDPRVKRTVFPAAVTAAEALNALAAATDATYVAFLAPNDRLAPAALGAVAAALHPASVLAAYSDEDRIGWSGMRTEPSFKPNFDYERLLSHNYIGGLFALRRSALQDLGGFRQTYDGIHFHDLLLRLSEAAPRSAVRHVPAVLYHRRRAPQALTADVRSGLRRRIVVEHLERRERRPDVVAGPVNRLIWPLPSPAPKVRVIVPTRDRPDLLGPCVAGVLNATGYPDLELVIVDNGSRTAAARAQLATLAEDRRVRVLPQSGPFNFSALCNAAALEQQTGMLAFVNDDILIVEPGWLKEMVCLAARPSVGAVGAKLYYPDGRLQHAGVVLGLGSEGVAGHEFRGAPCDEVGPQSRLVVTREVSAVTAGCMVVEAEKFHAVGGFDEDSFAVSFNDVDLCLRLQDRGWRTLWTPHARLIHLESASRKRERERDAAAVQRQANEASRLRGRWADLIAVSGYYHPALSRADETFSLAPLKGDAAPR
jgi:O-antigen biosynthesis protein